MDTTTEDDEHPGAGANRARTLIVGPPGHPFHPMVASVAIGGWVTSLGLDLASFVADAAWIYARTSYFVIAGATAIAAVASVIGLIDLTTVERGTEPFRTGVRHLMAMDIALALFTVSYLVRRRSDFRYHDSVGALALGLSLVAVLALSVGLVLGVRLVFRHGVRTEVATANE